MKIVLIRHGMTAGNKEKRYIGRTDEVLCEEGIMQLQRAVEEGCYPQAELIYCSPMKRCCETAKILYPHHQLFKIADFRECDFGLFEGKNYLELQGNADYQQWIDSNGQLPFPEGEAVSYFKHRTICAFEKAVQKLAQRNPEQMSWEGTAAMIVHGGTIMSIMEAFCGGDYYDYHCGNGCGYVCCYQPEEKRLILEQKINCC